MFIAAIFVVSGSTGNLSVYHTESRYVKLWCTHSMEYNAAFRSKGLDVHIETWMDLKTVPRKKAK